MLALNNGECQSNEDEMAPHLPGDNWDIPPIDPLDDRLGAAN